VKISTHIFGNHTRKKLPIPKIIDDHNYYMGGVDIADQLRSYYLTQQQVRRTWMSLFFWLLDVAAINSYVIYKKKYDNKIIHSDHNHFIHE